MADYHKFRDNISKLPNRALLILLVELEDERIRRKLSMDEYGKE